METERSRRMKAHLIATNEEFRGLASQHLEFAHKLDALESLPHLTDEEQGEETRLKKLKLRLKDQMEAIVSQYRSQAGRLTSGALATQVISRPVGLQAGRAFDFQAPPPSVMEPEPDPIRIPIADVFDLHTVPPRDVKAVVEEYLIEANRLGLRVLRIIHGRGIGVQREIVRGVLERTEFVADYRDAPAEAGGWGATIVTLIAPR